MKKTDLYRAAQGVKPAPYLKERLAANVIAPPERAWPRVAGIVMASCTVFVLIVAMWMMTVGELPFGGEPGKSIFAPGTSGTTEPTDREDAEPTGKAEPEDNGKAGPPDWYNSGFVLISNMSSDEFDEMIAAKKLVADAPPWYDGTNAGAPVLRHTLKESPEWVQECVAAQQEGTFGVNVIDGRYWYFGRLERPDLAIGYTEELIGDERIVYLFPLDVPEREDEFVIISIAIPQKITLCSVLDATESYSGGLFGYNAANDPQSESYNGGA